MGNGQAAFVRTQPATGKALVADQCRLDRVMVIIGTA